MRASKHLSPSLGALVFLFACGAEPPNTPIDAATGGDAAAPPSDAATTPDAAGQDSSGGDSGNPTTLPPSGLPTPPGPSNLPKPSGQPGGLAVLNWAGFAGAASFTFDDAQPSQIAHYTELQAVGVPMTFYLSTNNSTLTNYGTVFAQAVKDGHELGNHSVHHCHANLTGCSFGNALTTLDSEIDQCNTSIQQQFGQTVLTSASPFGDTGYDTPEQSRVFLNRGVGGGLVAPNDTSDALNLPIHMAATNEALSSFNGYTDSAHAGKWIIFLFHTISPTSATWYNPVDINTVTGAMSYAKGLGDLWVGTVARTGAYWRAQKMFSAVAPTQANGATTYTWTLPAHFPTGQYLRVKVTGGTLTQGKYTLVWDPHGYYEVSLDLGTLTISP
jgi:hypothetical protein